MRPLVTPEEMRAADEATIAAGTPAHVLMDRAGRAVSRSVLAELGARYGKRVTVVCGKGNNGGDGFVCARVLRSEGVRVTCCAVFDTNEASGAARHHLDRWLHAGGKVVPFERRHLETDLVVDAVFGTGFHGEPAGPAAQALHAIEHAIRGEEIEYGPDGAFAAPPVWPVPSVVSIDVPSAGIVPAHVIVALGAEKRQTFFAHMDTPAKVEVADIGIEVDDAVLHVFEERDAALHIPRPDPDDHKTSHGSLVILAGSDETTGAPVLTARAATRMGAGYVTLASTAEVVRVASLIVPEVLKQDVRGGSSLGPDALDAVGEQLDRATAVAVGPGIGIGDGQRALVERCLNEVHQPLVLDADALNVLAGSSDQLAEREHPLVLTPHAAELGRLLGCGTARVLEDRVWARLQAADGFSCTVVLKGRRTLIATPSFGVSAPPDGASSTLPSRRDKAHALTVPVGGPELATAGTGDVLTGAITTLLSRSGLPGSGAATACYCHGLAGAIAAERNGRVGVVAWDVAEALPAAIESLRAALP